MKIDFSKPILDVNDKPIIQTDADPQPGKPALVGTVVCNALLAIYQDERDLKGVEKVRRFKLAQTAAKCELSDVKVDDAALIKELVCKGFSPLLVARVFEVIDPPAKSKP